MYPGNIAQPVHHGDAGRSAGASATATHNGAQGNTEQHRETRTRSLARTPRPPAQIAALPCIRAAAGRRGRVLRPVCARPCPAGKGQICRLEGFAVALGDSRLPVQTARAALGRLCSANRTPAACARPPVQRRPRIAPSQARRWPLVYLSGDGSPRSSHP